MRQLKYSSLETEVHLLVSLMCASLYRKIITVASLIRMNISFKYARILIHIIASLWNFLSISESIDSSRGHRKPNWNFKRDEHAFYLWQARSCLFFQHELNRIASKSDFLINFGLSHKTDRKPAVNTVCDILSSIVQRKMLLVALKPRSKLRSSWPLNIHVDGQVLWSFARFFTYILYSF